MCNRILHLFLFQTLWKLQMERNSKEFRLKLNFKKKKKDLSGHHSTECPPRLSLDKAEPNISPSTLSLGRQLTSQLSKCTCLYKQTKNPTQLWAPMRLKKQWLRCPRCWRNTLMAFWERFFFNFIFAWILQNDPEKHLSWWWMWY